MARHRLALLSLCVVGLYTSTCAYKLLDPETGSSFRALQQSEQHVGPAVHAAGASAQSGQEHASSELQSEGRRLLRVDTAAEKSVPLIRGGLVRTPEDTRVLYREIEVFADGTATVTSTSNLQPGLPRNATSFSYT
jgi:hypothetical protein